MRIVENADSAWSAAHRQVLADTPTVQIGCRDCAEGAAAFGGVADVRRFPDGAIGVVDVLTSEVRIFAPDGSFRQALGGRGRGPGEFQLPDAMAVVKGDSIVVHDQGSFSQAWYSPAGEYARTVQDISMVEWSGLRAVPRGWLPDGRHFIAEDIQYTGLPARRGIAHAEWRLVSSDGEDLGMVGSFPARHGKALGLAGGYQVDGTTVFAPRRTYAVDATGLWHAFPAIFEIRHVLPDGVTDRIIRRRWTPERVAENLKQEYRDRQRNQARERLPSMSVQGRARVEAELQALAFADTLPAFRRIKETTDGGLWVEHYPRAEEIDFGNQDRYGLKGPPEWSVFDAHGRWLGTVVVPERFSVHEIGPDYVLGVWRDELDVQFVQLYALVTVDKS